MKILVIACIIAFIASVAATMYFTGTFKKDVSNPESDVSEQTIKKENSQTKNKQPVNQSIASNTNIKNGSLNSNAAKEIVMAKLELEKYKAQIAAESAKLSAIRSEIEALSNKAKSINKYKQMAIMYSAMKPNEAASVICELDEDTAKGILLEMDNKIAGKVMSAIAATNPKYAANISKLILKAEESSKFNNGS